MSKFDISTRTKMYKCPCCFETFNMLKDAEVHIKLHRDFGKLDSPIPCLVENCLSKIAEIKNLMKHIRTYHRATVENEAIELQNEHNHEMEQEEELAGGNNCQEPQVLSFEEFLGAFQNELSREIFEMLLDLRSKASITFSTTVLVVRMISTVINMLLDNVSRGLRGHFSLSLDHPDIASLLLQLTSFEKIKSCASQFDSEYKIRKKYQAHPLILSIYSLSPSVSLLLQSRAEVSFSKLSFFSNS